MNNDNKGIGLIADIPDDQRPREKALSMGMKALSDIELMAILFGTGIKGKGVMEMCREILDDNKGHISRVSNMSAHEFMQRYKGIGPAMALTLLAGLELGVRAAAESVKISEQAITSSKAAYDYMNSHLFNLDHEEFWVLLLKRNLKPLREFRVGQGGLSYTAVDPKIIIREALISNAGSMMLFHNHPSGALETSPQDIALTERIAKAAELFDMRVLDHLIIGHNNYYSFHDDGKL